MGIVWKYREENMVFAFNNSIVITMGDGGFTS